MVIPQRANLSVYAIMFSRLVLVELTTAQAEPSSQSQQQDRKSDAGGYRVHARASQGARHLWLRRSTRNQGRSLGYSRHWRLRSLLATVCVRGRLGMFLHSSHRRQFRVRSGISRASRASGTLGAGRSGRPSRSSRAGRSSRSSRATGSVPTGGISARRGDGDLAGRRFRRLRIIRVGRIGVG